MSRVMCVATARRAAVGLTLAGLTICSVAVANAGDFNPPYVNPPYTPAPYGGPGYESSYEPHGPCRILFERRVDPYGRPVEHRLRVCDEGSVPATPNWTAAPSDYGYAPPRYYGPVPSGYDPYPRPPAPIGPGYYN
jgi:hypothetical protein